MGSGLVDAVLHGAVLADNDYENIDLKVDSIEIFIREGPQPPQLVMPRGDEPLQASGGFPA